MKNIILKIKAYSLFMLMMLVSMSVYAQGVGVEGDETNLVVIIIGIVIMIIEAAARLYPDQKITGLIGLGINILKTISDYFNRGAKD